MLTGQKERGSQHPLFVRQFMLTEAVKMKKNQNTIL